MRAIIRCDCGFEAVGDDAEQLRAAAQAHSRITHRTELTDTALTELIGHGERTEDGS